MTSHTKRIVKFNTLTICIRNLNNIHVPSFFYHFSGKCLGVATRQRSPSPWGVQPSSGEGPWDQGSPSASWVRDYLCICWNRMKRLALSTGFLVLVKDSTYCMQGYFLPFQYFCPNTNRYAILCTFCYINEWLSYCKFTKFLRKKIKILFLSSTIGQGFFLAAGQVKHSWLHGKDDIKMSTFTMLFRIHCKIVGFFHITSWLRLQKLSNKMTAHWCKKLDPYWSIGDVMKTNKGILSHASCCKKLIYSVLCHSKQKIQTKIANSVC